MKLISITIFLVALLGMPKACKSGQQQQPPAPPANPAPVTKVKTKVKTKVETKVETKVKVKHQTNEDVDGDENDPDDDSDGAQSKSEQTVATTATVSITFCGNSSSVTVRGWDRNEVHVRIDNDEKLNLNYSNDGGKGAPASRIEILTKSDQGEFNHRGNCQSEGDVELDVPRGAVLDLTTNLGAIDVENVARVHAVSANGSIELRGITKAIEAKSFNGEINVLKSKGPISLVATSGSVDIRDSGPIDNWDGLTVSSVSGEVKISNCQFAQVRANSVSSELLWYGDLAKGGGYNFITTNGDITLVMPPTVSFRLDARMANQGALNTEFKLRTQGETSLKEIGQRVSGDYNGGSAQVNLTTFNGTLKLRMARK